MPASKRSRACDACHSIKIKCELGSSGRNPPCSRCLRLSKNCSISVPKSQKDKVAELEAQVELLTKTIELLRTTDVPTPPVERSFAAPPTREPPEQRVEEIERRPTARSISAHDQFLNLDKVIALPLQKVLHQRYVNEMSSRFDLLPLPNPHGFDILRLQKPLLLMAVMYAASDGLLHFDHREHLGNILLDLIVPSADSKPEKSLELIQALLITSLWYRLPTYHTKVTPRELIQLAVGVATDIGIDGTEGTSAVNLSFRNQNVSAAEARAALVVCRMLSSSIFVFLRTSPSVSWSVHDDLALFMLESPVDDQDRTRLVALYVRAERLCGHIATQLEFSNFDKFIDITEKYAYRLESTNSTTPSLSGSKLWEHAAMLYMHECVLHTPGNKQSFAAPYTAERLSVTDFPKPVVTQDHINSLVILRDNAHALIDLFSTLDNSTIMSFPALLFASRVSYSEYILVKLHLALSAPGNTFGTFMDPDSIMLDLYLQKAVDTRNAIHAIDPHCGTAKILSMPLRFREWSETYRSTNLLTGVHLHDGHDHATLDYNWSNMNADFDLAAPRENGFLDLFSDPDLPLSQIWTT